MGDITHQTVRRDQGEEILDLLVRIVLGLAFPILAINSFDGEKDLLDLLGGVVMGLVFFFSNRLSLFLMLLFKRVRGFFR